MPSLKINPKLPKPLQLIANLAAKHSKHAEDSTLKQSVFIDNLMGIRPCAYWYKNSKDDGSIYPSTPPELFVFADYGVDGACAGLLMRAPELKLADYPVGCFCELDGNGVVFGGRDTRHFIEMRLSAILQSWEEMENSAQLRELARARREQCHEVLLGIAKKLKILPDPKMNVFGWGQGQNELHMPSPIIPSGYHYLRTPDNVGVLARKEHFDLNYDEEITIENCRRVARKMLQRDYPASALYALKLHIRNIWIKGGFDYVKVLKDLQTVYLELGRPQLAKAAKIIEDNVRQSRRLRVKKET